jgi:hypothetical protein
MVCASQQPIPTSQGASPTLSSAVRWMLSAPLSCRLLVRTLSASCQECRPMHVHTFPRSSALASLLSHMGVRANPSLHPKCYSGLRPPAHSGELKR